MDGRDPSLPMQVFQAIGLQQHPRARTPRTSMLGTSFDVMTASSATFCEKAIFYLISFASKTIVCGRADVGRIHVLFLKGASFTSAAWACVFNSCGGRDEAPPA